MVTEENSSDKSSKKTPPRSTGPSEDLVTFLMDDLMDEVAKRLRQVLFFGASLASIVAAILGAWAATRLSGPFRKFSGIPTKYLTLFEIVLTAAAGLSSIFYLATFMYQRQEVKRKQMILSLQSQEVQFFERVRSDTEALLQERGHRGD